MRLVLDLQAAQTPSAPERGVARYATELASALVRRAPGAGHEVAAVLLNPALGPPRSLTPDLLAHPRLVRGSRRDVRSVADADPCGDVAHLVLSPVEDVPAPALLPEGVRAAGALVASVLYDVIPLRQPELYFSEESDLGAYRQHMSIHRTADLVLAISAHAAAEGAELLGLDPHRVAVVLGGAGPQFRPPGPGDPPLTLEGLRGPFTVCVGGPGEHKNLDRLVHAWARMRPEGRARRQLVVVGRLGGAEARLRALGTAAGLAEDELLLPGLVDDRLLRSLYGAAELSVVPSTHEGLGLTAVEALACGTPIVTSSTSSLPEVLDLAASTFDPFDVASMAVTLEAGLSDERLRAAILGRAAERLPAYTWDATAHRVLVALAGARRRGGPVRPARAAAGPPAPGRRRGRARIGLVCPLPPSTIGPAVYTARLVAPLRRHAEVVTIDTEGRSGSRIAGARRIPLTDLGRGSVAWADLDHVVTVVGNSGHHWPAVDQLRRWGGVAWLHEARLGAVLTERARALGLHGGTAGTWVRREAQRLAGGPPAGPGGVSATSGRLPRLPDATWADPGALARAGIGLTGYVVERASGLVCNSALALRLVQLDQPPGANMPPAAVLPPACPDPRHIPAPDPQEPPLVVALGIVDAKKSPEVLVGALARLRQDLDVRLAFVGPAPGGWARHLADLAAAAGATGAVEVTGEVDDATYWRWLQRASVAVQLRRGSFGESSGAVLELMAAGVPCITSVATAAELPSGSIEMVDPQVTAVDLAEMLRVLLVDRARRQALSIAARAAAAKWTFVDLAAALLPTLEALAGARPGAVLGPCGAPPAQRR